MTMSFLLEIRKAQKEDLDAISALLIQLGYDTPLSKIEHLISQSISEHSEVLVGVLDGSVIAVMSLIYFDYFPSAEKLCRITSIVVSEKARGGGIGKQLIDYAKVRAFANDCQVLEVTTSLKRKKTQAFYESIGFTKSSYKYVQRLGHTD